MELNKATAERLRSPVMKTWNYIGSDSLQLAEEYGERMTNAAAVEGCIDANRLASCAKDPEADKMIGQLCEEHGYDKVLKFLSRNIRLV